jgi:hypothetical protein
LDKKLQNETLVLREFQRKADEISFLIINSDLPWVDIAIQIQKLREEAELLFPDKMYLFEMIYISRFTRLWQQWRPEELPPSSF